MGPVTMSCESVCEMRIPLYYQYIIHREEGFLKHRCSGAYFIEGSIVQREAAGPSR